MTAAFLLGFVCGGASVLLAAVAFLAHQLPRDR
jgi:hypothetical protein